MRPADKLEFPAPNNFTGAGILLERIARAKKVVAYVSVGYYWMQVPITKKAARDSVQALLEERRRFEDQWPDEEHDDVQFQSEWLEPGTLLIGGDGTPEEASECEAER